MGRLHERIMLSLLANAFILCPAFSAPTPEDGLALDVGHTDTRFGDLWRDIVAGTSNNTSTSAHQKRVTTPPDGRLQFVSYAKGDQAYWTISLAVVMFNTGEKCNAVFNGLSTSQQIASAVATTAGLWIRNNVGANYHAGRTRTFYTQNYYGSTVVIAKLYYYSFTEPVISRAAQALASYWGLGQAISGFEPTNDPGPSINHRKRDGDAKDDKPVGSISVVSSLSFSHEELVRLRDILDSLPETAVKPENDSAPASLDKRGDGHGICFDWDIRYCRNKSWNVWNTCCDYECPSA